jgi:hypothetical protein
MAALFISGENHVTSSHSSSKRPPGYVTCRRAIFFHSIKMALTSKVVRKTIVVLQGTLKLSRPAADNGRHPKI